MYGDQNAMRQLSGLGISPGLAAGKAFVYRDILYRDHESYDISRSQIEDEDARFDKALRNVLQDLEHAAERIDTETDEGLADIFRAHQAMLSDTSLHGEIRDEVKTELVTVEQAVKRVFRRWERKFKEMENEQFRQRSEDMADLGRRLLRSLAGVSAHTLEDMPAGSILVAKRLLPSDTVFLNRQSTAGVVVELGGPLSHAALLTRELGVPAVSQVSDLVSTITPGETILVDGNDGAVIVKPDEDTDKCFRREIEKQRAMSVTVRKRADGPATTKDGVTVEVFANVGGEEDIERAVENGADGIGLYRIEHVYLSRQSPPSEGELLKYLQRALKAAKGKSVTVRLLDAGGDCTSSATMVIRGR